MTRKLNAQHGHKKRCRPVSLVPDELILKPTLLELVPLSDTTIWREERRGRFPRRIWISEKRVAWHRREIEAWLDARTAERNATIEAA